MTGGGPPGDVGRAMLGDDEYDELERSGMGLLISDAAWSDLERLGRSVDAGWSMHAADGAAGPCGDHEECRAVGQLTSEMASALLLLRAGVPDGSETVEAGFSPGDAVRAGEEAAGLAADMCFVIRQRRWKTVAARAFRHLGSIERGRRIAASGAPVHERVAEAYVALMQRRTSAWLVSRERWG